MLERLAHVVGLDAGMQPFVASELVCKCVCSLLG